ncbi:fungal-specific transcription factor domain-containing protein [Aspergillus heterothallicus]
MTELMLACRSPDASTRGDQPPAPQHAVESPSSLGAHAGVIPGSGTRHGIGPEADVAPYDSTAVWDNGNGSLLPWLGFANSPVLPEWTSSHDQRLPEPGCQGTQAQQSVSLSYGTTRHGSDTPNNDVSIGAIEAPQGDDYLSDSIYSDQGLYQNTSESSAGPLLGTIDLVWPYLDLYPIPLIKIMDALKSLSAYTPVQETWFNIDLMQSYLRNYFQHFHPSTPFIHTPSWTITGTRPHLLFAMALTGAMYTPGAPIQSESMQAIYQVAEHLIFEYDQMDSEVVQVDTLQALHLLSLHDAYLARTLATSPVFDYGRLVSRVRAAGYLKDDFSFDERGTGWNHWIERECTRRTVFIIYLVDAIREIFFREPPKISPYEIDLELPCHDLAFNAKTEDEWRAQYSASDLSRLHYSSILTAFVNGVPSTDKVSLSVMGSFILLHGTVYQHRTEFGAMN